MAWQCAQTTLQVKWSSICNELHIDETPHFNYLIDSRLLTRQGQMFVNMARGESKVNYLSRQFK